MINGLYPLHQYFERAIAQGGKIMYVKCRECFGKGCSCCGYSGVRVEPYFADKKEDEYMTCPSCKGEGYIPHRGLYGETLKQTCYKCYGYGIVNRRSGTY